MEYNAERNAVILKSASRDSAKQVSAKRQESVKLTYITVKTPNAAVMNSGVVPIRAPTCTATQISTI